MNKETEQAAQDSWGNYEHQYGNLHSTSYISGFEAGAEWQSKAAPTPTIQEEFSGKRLFIECNPMDIDSIPFVNTNFAVKEINMPELNIIELLKGWVKGEIKYRENLYFESSDMQEKKWYKCQRDILKTVLSQIDYLPSQTPPQKAEGEAEPIKQ